VVHLKNGEGIFIIQKNKIIKFDKKRKKKISINFSASSELSNMISFLEILFWEIFHLHAFRGPNHGRGISPGGNNQNANQFLIVFGLISFGCGCGCNKPYLCPILTNPTFGPLFGVKIFGRIFLKCLSFGMKRASTEISSTMKYKLTKIFNLRFYFCIETS
jgi:hypothetical protein